ncbi:hypothetical protein GGI35DRAFT_421436 [Trichoderma velutinum]
MAVFFSRKHDLGFDKLGSFSSFLFYKLRYTFFLVVPYTREISASESGARSVFVLSFFTWLMGSIRWMGRCWSTGRSGLVHIRLLCWDFIVFFFIFLLIIVSSLFPLTLHIYSQL